MRIQSLSDASPVIGKSPFVARDYTYADLNLTFAPNPITGDLNPLKDLEAIKASVRNLILTNYNERPFQPEIGSGIRGLLFEPADIITMHDIEEAVKRTIENFEPRVIVLGVQVTDDVDNNSYTISIEYRILSNQQVGSTTLVLERLR